MSDWTHYERRASALLHLAEATLKASDDGRAERLFLVAAENLHRAASLASPAKAAGLVGKAEDIMDLVEGVAAIAPNQDDPGQGSLAQPWQVIRNTGVTFDDIVGLDEPKRLIYNMVVRPLADPAGAIRWRKRVGGGILLHGPPGNGKTFLAKAVAGELGAVFLNVHSPTLISKWVGDSEKHVDALFQEARRHDLCVLFIDEAEALLSCRGSGSTVMDRVVPTFLAAMDGIAGRHDGLLLLGATNRLDAIDPASLRPGRFDRQVYVGLPDADARARILARILDGLPASPAVDPATLAGGLDGYSAADIAQVCEEATDLAFDREQDQGRPTMLTPDDFARAIESVKPSLSAEDIQRDHDIRRRMETRP